jgi:hypothetical protein
LGRGVWVLKIDANSSTANQRACTFNEKTANQKFWFWCKHPKSISRDFLFLRGSMTDSRSHVIGLRLVTALLLAQITKARPEHTSPVRTDKRLYHCAGLGSNHTIWRASVEFLLAQQQFILGCSDPWGHQS